MNLVENRYSFRYKGASQLRQGMPSMGKKKSSDGVGQCRFDLCIPFGFEIEDLKMAIPSTIITGTIAYLVLGAVMLAMVFSMRSVGKLSKDDAA